MTAPTDALRAECEKSLAEFIAREIDAGDPTKKAADWFRAGFNVLAPEAAASRLAIEATLKLADSLAEMAAQGAGFYPDWGSRVIQAVRALRADHHQPGANHDP